MNDIYVTTSNHAEQQSCQLAEQFSRKLQLPYIPRQKRSLAALNCVMGKNKAIVVNRDSIIVFAEDQKFYFHPSMAKVRIKNICQGGSDPLITAFKQPQKPQKFLDCTLGMSSDAIVASFLLGEQAQIIGLEKSKLLAAIVSFGLEHYDDGDTKLIQAMRRIKVICADYKQYLLNCSNNGYDIIYFDPMFVQKVEKSVALNPLRIFASYDRIEKQDINQAVRAAKQAVVMKSRRNSSEFNRLGFIEKFGGKYSTVQYGIIRKSGDKNECI